MARVVQNRGLAGHIPGLALTESTKNALNICSLFFHSVFLEFLKFRFMISYFIKLSRIEG